MSITDELREFIGTHLYLGATALGGWKEAAFAIADRIDEAHKHAIAYVDDRDQETMAEHGWVKLPVDADGEYIHIGDRVENNERVVRIVLTDGSWEPSVYIEKLPNVMHEYFCNEISHYHAPTVEGILREFALACEDAGNAGPEVERTIAEYAKRLRLKEDE